jgi:hypothetical protein
MCCANKDLVIEMDGIVSRCVRCDSVESREVFISLRMWSGLVIQATTAFALTGGRPSGRMSWMCLYNSSCSS